MKRSVGLILAVGGLIAALSQGAAGHPIPDEESDQTPSCEITLPEDAIAELEQGDVVDLAIVLSDGCHDPHLHGLRFHAASLPVGLRLDPDTGRITGVLAAQPIPIVTWSVETSYWYHTEATGDGVTFAEDEGGAIAVGGASYASTAMVHDPVAAADAGFPAAEAPAPLPVPGPVATPVPTLPPTTGPTTEPTTQPTTEPTTQPTTEPTTQPTTQPTTDTETGEPEPNDTETADPQPSPVPAPTSEATRSTGEGVIIERPDGTRVSVNWDGHQQMVEGSPVAVTVVFEELESEADEAREAELPASDSGSDKHTEIRSLPHRFIARLRTSSRSIEVDEPDRRFRIEPQLPISGERWKAQATWIIHPLMAGTFKIYVDFLDEDGFEVSETTPIDITVEALPVEVDPALTRLWNNINKPAPVGVISVGAGIVAGKFGSDANRKRKTNKEAKRDEPGAKT